MSLTVVGSGNPSAPTFPVQRSVRLRSSASAYFNRTPISSGSRTTFTWSGWVKRGTLGTRQVLFSSGGGVNSSVDLFFNSVSSDDLQFEEYDVSTNYRVRTNALYRDPSAWYHVVLAVDTTQATDTNRIKIYVNGSLVTFLFTSYPAQNFAYYINTASYPAKIGLGTQYTTSYFDGYLTEVNFIDGQALTPTSFGAYNNYGVWSPAKYSGTYGTNGFYLNFQDNSAATATTIGKDSSGNGNNWTPNNISVTAGVTYDSMLDVPTLTSNTNANFAVGNPLNPDGSTWSGGNLNFSLPNSTNNAQGTFAVTSGKWYWEVVYSAQANGTGVQQTGLTTRWTSGVVYAPDGTKYVNGTNSAYGAAYVVGDIIGVALDMDGSTVTFYKNNVSQGSISLTGSGCVNATFTTSAGGGSTSTGSVNFGQRPFSYTPPTGYVALNTYNLPTPTIPNGAAYMAATTYTGTGTTQSIANTVNGVNFQPDFVWFKSRATTYAHALFDSVRGVTKGVETNSTAAELTSTAGNDLSAFTSTGFTVGAPQNWNSPNNASSNPVAWQWKANGTPAVTNTSGSIPSTISANTTAGFSIVTYTGTGANATVGHGLGVAPKMIIGKVRSTTNDWVVYHSSIGNTGAVFLDLTNATSTSINYWNNTSPTSSVFTVGIAAGINNSASTYVSYCFAEIAGFSKFGSYTGNGSADGPFIYTGFRPRFVLTKVSSTTGDWTIVDTSRSAYNLSTATLFPNSTAAEGSGFQIDVLSNGFKLRSTGQNTSSATYIYACFAENPFNYSLAR